MKTYNLLIALVLISVMLLTGCNSELRVGELQTDSQSVEVGDAESVRVEINFGAGDLKVSGGAEKLLEADFTYNVARLKPEVKFTDRSLVIWEPGKEGRIDWRGIRDFRNEWDLRLNNAVPMDLSVDMGAGTSDLQLSGLSLTGLEINLGASDSTIDLSGSWARDLDATIVAGAAAITVVLPKDVGVRVEIEAGPTAINASGLTKDGNVYTNAAYGVSDVTLKIHLEAGVGQINLEVEE